MARFHFILLAVFLYFVTFIYADATVETLSGPIGQGATVTISYKVVGTPTIKVTLKAVDQTSKNEFPISDDLPAAGTSLTWMVNVPPGTYVLAINDGTGQKFSGPFVVQAGTLPPSTGTPTTPAATTAPATTPAGTTTPATTPAGTTTPPASKSPASSSSSGTGAQVSSSPAATPTSKSGAPTSFSGYSLLVSLTVVAAVMFHLA